MRYYEQVIAQTSKKLKVRGYKLQESFREPFERLSHHRRWPISGATSLRWPCWSLDLRKRIES